MKQPFYKRALSYVTDIVIESTSSEVNQTLDVLLSRGRYQLCASNAIYSFEDLYVNYKIAFEKIKWEKEEFREVLILGLGLGSIPQILENKFNLKFNYTAVEIDEEVARLAHKYVLSELESHVETIIADASNFMMQNNRIYDLICMDVFLDDVIPHRFIKEDFLLDLKKALGANGLLLYNRLYRTKKDKKLTDEFYNSIFKNVFQNAAALNVKGNLMLMNRSSD